MRRKKYLLVIDHMSIINTYINKYFSPYQFHYSEDIGIELSVRRGHVALFNAVAANCVRFWAVFKDQIFKFSKIKLTKDERRSIQWCSTGDWFYWYFKWKSKFGIVFLFINPKSGQLDVIKEQNMNPNT